MAGPAEFYYNIDEGTVEEGRQSPGNELMGPYATREEAQNALSRAAARNEKWEDEDEKWEDWGRPAADGPGNDAV